MKRAALCLIVLLSGCSTKAVQSPAPPPQKPVQRQSSVVYLNESRNWKPLTSNLAEVSALARELVRQAILLAARDELGLATRDAWLGDAMPTEGGNAPLEVVAPLQEPFIVEVVSGFSSNREVLVRHQLGEPARRPNYFEYRDLTMVAESLSRAELLDGLRKAGFDGRANRRDESVAVPENVEKLLAEMNHFSQFDAVRQLHELMRTKGESSALLGALVRGYANLGILSEFCWYPAHKVFKARALLYAQRMLARDEKSPVARWHRSYAAAIAGDHCWALSDLDEAEKARQAIPEKDRPPMPAWAQLIGPLCRYQIEELGKHVDDRDVGQLATLLRFLAVDQIGGRVWPIQTALEALQNIPECYFVHDKLCEYAGISLLHSATLAPIKILGETVYGRLESIPDLPPRVSAVMTAKRILDSRLWARMNGDEPPSWENEFPIRRVLINALRDTTELTAANAKDGAPDIIRGEPSWAALGTLIRDISFLQVCRRAKFERDQWNVPTDKWMETAAPLAEGHPFKPFFDSFTWSQNKRQDALSRLYKVDVSGVDLAASALYSPFTYCKDQSRPTQFWRNQDFIVGDLVATLRILDRTKDAPKETVVPLTKTLLGISPYSPMARAVLVRCDWEGSQPTIAQWEKEAAPYPGLLSALAQRYIEAKRYADAERSLKLALEILPGDVVIWRQLADAYRLQGKTDRWVATLEEYLQKPDYDLNHSRVQSDIAQYYMDHKEWRKALPYAEGAAQSYAGFGLIAAAKCHEGLRHWDQAEKYHQACSERYESSSLSWYFFCRRTGHGDVEAARDHVKSQLTKGKDSSYHATAFELVAFYLLEKRPEMALTAMEQAPANDLGSYDIVWSALIADLAGDVKRRDAALERVKTLAAEPNRKNQDGNADANDNTLFADEGVHVLADLIINDLKKGGKGQIDLNAADKLTASYDLWFRSWFYYYLGQYLDIHGRRSDADRCMKQCMSSSEQGFHRILASAMLVEHGNKPEDFDAFLQPNTNEGKKAGDKGQTGDKKDEKSS